MPSNFDQLSIKEFYEEYGKPETVSIKARSGKALPPNVPAKAVIPLSLGKPAEEFSLADARVILADFGEAFAPGRTDRRAEDCHTPLATRPPEARFEPQSTLSYSADIWSLATTVWEIIGMKAIFSSEFVNADEVVAQQIDVLGPMPRSWWERWKEREKFFDADGGPKDSKSAWPPIEEAFEQGVQAYRRKLGQGHFEEEEATAILDLMRRMLTFRPKDRPSAAEVLESDWVVRWVLPDVNEALKASHEGAQKLISNL